MTRLVDDQVDVGVQSFLRLLSNSSRLPTLLETFTHGQSPIVLILLWRDSLTAENPTIAQPSD